jgi:hypothetical protein
MATTFDATLTAPKDRIRFALGDTNVGAVKAALSDLMELPVDDSIYAGLLAAHGQDERAVTLALAEALIMRYSQEPTKVGIGSVENAEWAARLTGWQHLASRIRAELEQESTQANRRAAQAGLTQLTQRASGLGRSEYRRNHRV